MGIIGDFRERGRFLTTLKVVKDNWVALGVCMAVWGSDGGPQGFTWPIYTPMAWMKWVEKKDGCHSVRSFCGTLINLVISMTPGRHDAKTSSMSIHINDVGLTLI